MPTWPDVTVVGDGPTGAVVATIDKRGILDGSDRRFFAPMYIRQQLLATSVDQFIWTCIEGVWQVIGGRSAITVSGGSSAIVQVHHCAGAVAPSSGTNQFTGAFDLEETAPNVQTGTLITAPNDFIPGDSLGLDFNGTLTGLVGNITVLLKRIG